MKYIFGILSSSFCDFCYREALVNSMLELQKKYHDARMERDKELYERQIKIVDAQIDRLVYDLYGLTEEEVRVVGGGLK